VDPAILRHFARVILWSDYRAELSKLTVPTLILQCTDDSIAPASVGEYLHQHIRGSSIRHLQATGHCPHLSHPEETIALIREFLSTS
jgi:sigma-B regulation protein RsbQ